MYLKLRLTDLAVAEGLVCVELKQVTTRIKALIIALKAFQYSLLKDETDICSSSIRSARTFLVVTWLLEERNLRTLAVIQMLKKSGDHAEIMYLTSKIAYTNASVTSRCNFRDLLKRM